jgi:hypothetical protein
MSQKLNYAPEDVKTSEVLIAARAGSGVTFGMLPHQPGEEPEIVAISPRQAEAVNLRIGDTVEVGYVENFPEHVDRVPWRAVAVYGKPLSDGPGVRGVKPTEVRKTVEQQVANIVDEGEVWNRGLMYEEMFGQGYVALTASDTERRRYEAVGHALARLHDTGKIACAKVYGPGKKNATSLFYATTTQALARVLLGDDKAVVEEPEEGVE